MSDKVLREQRRLYGANFEVHSDSPQGTFQNDRETQNLRFERLFRQILPQDEPVSIHDVGCGVADLHGYLLERGIQHRYSGSEIVQSMVDVAMSKYPDIEVFNHDVLKADAPEEYDFVVLSGVFNIPGDVPGSDWVEFCHAMVEKMYAMCRMGIAFNFLTSYNTYSVDDLSYFDPTKFFDFCIRRLSRFVILDHGFPLYESSITVFKPAYIRARYSNDKFAKYFGDD